MSELFLQQSKAINEIKSCKRLCLHKGKTLGVNDIVDDIDRVNAERLCKSGVCEMLTGEITENSTVEADSAKDLDEMTKAELIAYAESVGIEVDTKANKANIIKTITEADTPDTGMPQ